MKKYIYCIFIVVIAIFLIGSAFLYWLPSKDIVVEKYPTYSDAVRLEAFDHGMIPDFLPRSSKNIVSLRNLDVNSLEVAFDFAEGDFDKFLSQQKKGTEVEIRKIMKDVDETMETSDPSVLIVIPKVESADSDSQGILIVNTKQRHAIYFSR
jgi:hypothetical protein